jgi:hypothetical protein
MTMQGCDTSAPLFPSRGGRGDAWRDLHERYGPQHMGAGRLYRGRRDGSELWRERNVTQRRCPRHLLGVRVSRDKTPGAGEAKS